MMSATRVRSLRPRLPPGRKRAKSSGWKFRSMERATASASPITRVQVVELFGDSGWGDAMRATRAPVWLDEAAVSPYTRSQCLPFA